MSVRSKIRGTIETIFQIGLGGPQWKNNAGVIEARDTDDTVYIVVRGGVAVAVTPGNNDLLTFLQYAPAYYGDGSDGAAAFNGAATPPGSTRNSATHYTLSRDIYYSSAVVSAGVTIATNGWRFFCTGALNLAGSNSFLDNSGQPGSVGAVGSGGAGGVAGGNNSIGGQIVATGGAGGGPSAAGGAGVSVNGNCWGGSGGNGFASIGAGGPGGIAVLAAPNNQSPPRMAFDMMSGSTQPIAQLRLQTSNFVLGGAAGGGGGGGAAIGGGGGGAGGGVLIVCSKIITGAGSIRANGGNGGGSTGGGGGGGGGGGFVGLIYTDTSTWTGTAQASGGVGAGAAGPGVDGAVVPLVG